MSKAIQSLWTLHNNPFIFGHLFASFYQSLGEKPKSVLLSYLVLPLVLYPESRKFLVIARSTSSIRTMMSERRRIYGLNERIDEYRELTNRSVQNCVDMGILKVGDTLSVDVVSDGGISLMCDANLRKAAKHLGILFVPFDVPTIYRMIGVKKI